MAHYNERVTGSPVGMPYFLHQQVHHAAPVFLFQRPSPMPSYRSEEMRSFHASELRRYWDQRTLRGLAAGTIRKLNLARQFFFGLEQSFALLALPLLWLDPRRRGPLVLLVAGLLPTLLVLWWLPHYVAPLTGLFVLVLVEALRRLRELDVAGRPLGRALVRASLILAVLSVPVQVERLRQSQRSWAIRRAEIVRDLERSDGRDLVFVRYGADHDVGREWVYNGADLDGAEVLFARDLERDANEPLLTYYPRRRAWLLTYEQSGETIVLEPYPGR